MDSAVVARLIQLNQDFYARFGDSFSATRQRIQPGVRRILENFAEDETILDLGCGNGELARELARRGQRGSYLGADFSLPLLHAAELPSVETSEGASFSTAFVQMDITKLSASLCANRYSLIVAFAALHHIPSTELRLDILRTIRQLLKPAGLFIHSNWQFLNSEKLRKRIQPWERVSISSSEVDAGDYLLDWRSGGEGLRYVHCFSESELNELAVAADFQIVETFLSDGETGNLGLYQIWSPC
ncbi:MAG: hypothetical protein B6D38_12270 [Anaerolineae bacterium UTCFX1]|jgi:2-polyprenyl-3-methyl-5-hydroxy-6-metoxy-1,4-benzoquinol methylase|nr:MAG: hypothetical protein B6D38_12270 [Anaerolineae bacterium UTCFX1]